MKQQPESIGIIGAGITGVASAYVLAQQGFKVVVYDSHLPGEGGPSFGNAGHIAASDILPLSTPNIFYKAVKLLIKPNGPLKIDIASIKSLAPWLWKFYLNSEPKRFSLAIDALTFLGRRCLNDTQKLFRDANIESMYRPLPCAFIYDNKKSLIASKPYWQLKADRGFTHTPLSKNDLHKQLPALSNTFSHGVNSNNWAMVGNPIDVVRGIAYAAKQLSVEYRQHNIEGISIHQDHVMTHARAKSDTHDHIVICAGLGSVRIAKSIGENLPLIAERGYNLTIAQPKIKLHQPIVFADRGVVATPLECGIRLGGWAHYGQISLREKASFFAKIRNIARELFPQINLRHVTQWSGARPSTPDSIPIISASTSSQRILYNCGHGHYGLTHAATSAQIISKLIQTSSYGQEQFKPYSVTRFL